MLLYARIPGFYAEIERRDHPELRQRPVIVGGNPRKRGLVQSATPDACAAGVREGMTMIEALERCPRARALPTNMRLYREVANQLRARLRRESRRVEPAGLDAAWLDPRDAGDPAIRVADRLCTGVREELLLPLRVGVAPVKFLAKIASELAGAEGVFSISPNELPGFLKPLPVSRLPGVGPRTEARLAELSVHTAGELVALGRRAVEEALGNHGLAILAYAQGQDQTVIRRAPLRRSVSQEVTLGTPELDRASLEEHLAELARGLESGLALEELAARKLILKVRYSGQDAATRSLTLVRPVRQASDLARLARELLERTQAGLRPIRGLGLAAASLVQRRREDRQIDLFERRGPEGSDSLKPGG